MSRERRKRFYAAILKEGGTSLDAVGDIFETKAEALRWSDEDEEFIAEIRVVKIIKRPPGERPGSRVQGEGE